LIIAAPVKQAVLYLLSNGGMWYFDLDDWHAAQNYLFFGVCKYPFCGVVKVLKVKKSG
jgi:hypothetical protein